MTPGLIGGNYHVGTVDFPCFRGHDFGRTQLGKGLLVRAVVSGLLAGLDDCWCGCPRDESIDVAGDVCHDADLDDARIGRMGPDEMTELRWEKRKVMKG